MHHPTKMLMKSQSRRRRSFNVKRLLFEALEPRAMLSTAPLPLHEFGPTTRSAHADHAFHSPAIEAPPPRHAEPSGRAPDFGRHGIEPRADRRRDRIPPPPLVSSQPLSSPAAPPLAPLTPPAPVIDAQPVPTIQPRTPAPITRVASIPQTVQTVATSRVVPEAADARVENAADSPSSDAPRENSPDAASPAVPSPPRIDRVPDGGMIEIGVSRGLDHPAPSFNPARDDEWWPPQRRATDQPSDKTLDDEPRDALPSTDAAQLPADEEDDEEADGRNCLEDDDDEDGELATDEVFADWEQRAAEGGMIELALADSGPATPPETRAEPTSAVDEGNPGEATVADPAVAPPATARIEMDRSQGHVPSLEVAAAPRETAGLPNEFLGSQTESPESASPPASAPVETPAFETTPSA